MHSKGGRPQRRPQRRLGRRLEGVAKAVGGGYCRLQVPLSLALAVRGTVAGHRLGGVEGGWGYPPPFPMHPCPGAQVLCSAVPPPGGRGGHPCCRIWNHSTALPCTVSRVASGESSGVVSSR